MDTFDSVVVGGGIAGLLTALRLARSGHAVALVEADRLGSGATCANHGMLHSGALYVSRHDHVVRHCQEAHAAFSALLADAEVPVNEAVYVVPSADADMLRVGLDHHLIAHRTIDPSDVTELDATAATAHILLSINERVFSSRRIVAILAGQCLAAGVAIFTGVGVTRIAHALGKVTGVVLGTADRLPARHVILAAGIGTAPLLADLGSRQARLLKSRLDMMVHFPVARITRGLVFAAQDRPVVMPTLNGGVLASFFGGVQPEITGRRAFPVDLGKAVSLLHETGRAFASEVVDSAEAVAYVAGKTDYVGSAHTEKGSVNPGFHVIDHVAVEDLYGLYTVVTGKMTLGFHASKAVADLILAADQPLAISPDPGAQTPDTPSRLLAVEPWAPVARL